MTLLFADGLDSGLSKITIVSGSPTWNSAGGVYGTGAMEMAAGADGAHVTYIYPYLPTSTISGNPITRISFWMKLATPVSTLSYPLYFQELNGLGNYAPVTLATNGRLAFNQYTTGGTYQVVNLTTYPRIDDNAWHHIEIGIRFPSSSPSLGSFLFYAVDGTTIYNGTGIDLRGGGPFVQGGINAFTFRNVRNGLVSYDDIIIWNEYNTSDNFNDIVGPTRIFTLRPSADNTVSSTASSGTDRFAMINEPALNTANFVTLSANTTDIYDLTDTSNVKGQIIGVQATLYFSSNAAGYQTNVRPFLISNNVRANGNIATSISTTSIEVNYRINKNFGSSNTSWTISAINSLQAGFENIG